MRENVRIGHNRQGAVRVGESLFRSTRQKTADQGVPGLRVIALAANTPQALGERCGKIDSTKGIREVHR